MAIKWLRSCRELLALLLLSFATSQAFKSQVHHDLVVEGNPIRKVVSMMERMAPGQGDMRTRSDRPRSLTHLSHLSVYSQSLCGTPEAKKVEEEGKTEEDLYEKFEWGVLAYFCMALTCGANQVLLQEDLG